jgi:tetratricopeptide (TPR) repeat protein
VQLARQALAQFLDRASLRVVLARALADAGNIDEALTTLTAGAPGDPALDQERARMLGTIGRIDEALALARSCREHAPELLLRLLVKHGRLEEAAQVEAAVAARAPGDPSLLELRAARHRQDPLALLAICDQALAARPDSSQAVHYKIIALAQLGRNDEARHLMGLDTLLSIQFLADPPLEFVRKEILANPSLHPDPAGHASRHGLRTRTFPLPGDRASTLLMGSIRTAIGDYAAALTGDHPFAVSRPAQATLTPWALVFRSAGHQVLHHHPEPWLTGVFYVSAPTGSPRPGAIRIGRLPDWAGVETPWTPLVVEPEPGRLILFPSFVPHETLPTRSDDERISIAFDVRAAAA